MRRTERSGRLTEAAVKGVDCCFLAQCQKSHLLHEKDSDRSRNQCAVYLKLKKKSVWLEYPQ